MASGGPLAIVKARVEDEEKIFLFLGCLRQLKVCFFENLKVVAQITVNMGVGKGIMLFLVETQFISFFCSVSLGHKGTRAFA